LGRAAAWTSDVETRWATPWLSWDDFPRFAAQLVNWTLPAPKADRLTASTHLRENTGVIKLEAFDQSGLPLNFLFAHASIIGPDLSVFETELSQVGPGRYQAEIVLSQPGTYLIRLGVNDGDASLGGEILGLVLPYSPEYRDFGTDVPFLQVLAGITGGDRLKDPVAAFIHNLEITAKSREIWQPLLFIVALLFPLDVAIRRLMLGRSDLKNASEWVKVRLPRKQDLQKSSDARIQGLFSAKDRVRWQQLRANIDPPNQIEVEKNANQPEGRQTFPETIISSDNHQNQSSEENMRDTISRLKNAKNRAGRNHQ
jgi:hypothetical protein